MHEVTRILSALEQGDPHAAEQLLPLVYDELRRLAAQKLAKEKPGKTLQATALVHEAWRRPYAFTEQGVAMVSSVLNSERAIEVNIAVMCAFVKLREILATHKDLARKLDELEKSKKGNQWARRRRREQRFER